MRDKITLTNLKVLIVCPSYELNTTTRKALDDCQYLRDIGGNPTLYCFKDSLVEKEAERLALPRTFYRGLDRKKLNFLSYFLDIRKVLKDEWDVVHCYDLKFLWPLSFWLFYRLRLPLFFTFHEYSKNSLFGELQKILLKRVDNIFVFSEQTKSYFLDQFSYPQRRMKNSGFGIEKFNIDEKPTSVFYISTVLSNPQQIDNLRALLLSIISLKEQDEFKDIRLRVHSVKKIKDFYAYTEIKPLLESEALKDSIEISQECSRAKVLMDTNVFLSLSFDEPISDFEIACLEAHIQCIVPRTATRKEELKKYLGSEAQTYYFQDSRAIREGIEKSFRRSLDRKQQISIDSGHDFESYSEMIHSTYIKSVSKRLRLDSLRK